MDELLEMGRGGEAILTHTSVLRGVSCKISPPLYLCLSHYRHTLEIVIFVLDHLNKANKVKQIIQIVWFTSAY